MEIIAIEQSEPLVRPHLNAGSNGTSEEPGHSSHGSPLPATEAPASTESDFHDTRGTHRTQLAARPAERSPAALARIGLGWKRVVQVADRTWGGSWRTETYSFIISITALVGLVTTLLAHQNKPLPQWPQLVTINSIISLFP
jgi:hypothetical protein